MFSLTSGHQDLEVARYGRATTQVARKYEERKAENIWSPRTKVLWIFLVYVPVPFPSSAARDAARDHPSKSTVALFPKKRHSSSAEVRHVHQPHTSGPHATSSKPSRLSLPAIFATSQSVKAPKPTIGRPWKSCCSSNTDSSHRSTELCCLWPNIVDVAASKIKNYANPTGNF